MLTYWQHKSQNLAALPRALHTEIKYTKSQSTYGKRIRTNVLYIFFGKEIHQSRATLLSINVSVKRIIN